MQETIEGSQDGEENGGNGSSYNQSVAKEQDVHSLANGGEDEDQGSNDGSGEGEVGEGGEGNSDGDESSDKEISDEEKTNGEESSKIETTDEDKTDSEETDESSESENEKGKEEFMAYCGIIILKSLHNTISIVDMAKMLPLYRICLKPQMCSILVCVVYS